MSNGKSILVDVSRCTGCRGCQIACKQWNELPGTKTVQSGTYQNPPNMGGDTYKVVRFFEGKDENAKTYWRFVSDMCRHCIDAPCAFAVDEGVIVTKESGAVVFTDKTVVDDYDAVFGACPYAIPHENKKTGLLTKCTMCYDRIEDGKLPACVLSCPTGCMEFGDRDDILKKVEKRVTELKKKYPNAHALHPEDVRVIYILTDADDKFGTVSGY